MEFLTFTKAVELVGMAGFEPATSRLSAGCSSQAKLHAPEQSSDKHTHFEYAHRALFRLECQ